MRRKFIGIAAISVFVLSTLRAQDAKFAADNLKYSGDFYSKVHFVAIASLPASFKYDRYPSGGPERIQCDDGTYARQHGRPWRYLNDKMRTGLPIDYPERNRYVMTFALREDWGRTGKPVDKETARKLDGWIKLAEAALSVTPANAKLLNKSETTDGLAQWVFEVPSENPNGVPARFTFRKPLGDKNENVLLHEFSGPLRLQGGKVVSGDATDIVRLGFGYMMRAQQGYEVSEFVWEEMQQAREEKDASSGKESPRSSALGSSPHPSGQSAAATTKSPTPGAEESDGDLVNRGIEKAKNGDLDGALADFDRAIELNPKDDAAYYNRAQTKRLKKDAAGAIADYTRAIELGSKNPAAYNNRGNARAETNDRDGAIADYTRAIELKPDYARAYYNRAVTKKAKGDAAGAEADFKMAHKLDPELASEESGADSSSNGATANSGATGTTVSLLDGKLKIDIPPGFSRDPDNPKEPKTLARFSGPDGAWGEVLRGTHGLTPDKLEGYLKMRVAEYSKGFKWLPKDSHLQWLKKEIVTIDGRKWADWRFVPMLKGKKDYSYNPVYTRFLTTSYKGQLLEINFTSNLNTAPELKAEIDHIMESVHLEE